MTSRNILIFLSGFATAVVLSRFDFAREYITGGNKFFN